MLYLQSPTLQEAKLRKTRSIERLFILNQSCYLPFKLCRVPSSQSRIKTVCDYGRGKVRLYRRSQ